MSVPCKRTDSDEVRRKATEETLESHGNFDIRLFSDGSVIEKLGAGAAILYEGNKVVGKAIAPGGDLCSSYRSEGVALQCGIKCLSEKRGIQKEGRSLLIATDSQSLLTALSAGPLKQTDRLGSDLWNSLIMLLNSGISKIKGVFVYSHCGIKENEEADKLAASALEKYGKEKLSTSQQKAPISLQAVKSEAKSALTKIWAGSIPTDTARHAACGNKVSDLKLSSTLSRKDEVMLHQLRVGECIMMGKLRSRLKIDESPLCRWCKEKEETVEHIYSECKAPDIIGLRNSLNFPDVTVLFKDPKLGLIFCNEALKIINK